MRRPSVDQTIYRWVGARTLEQEANLLFQAAQSVVNQRWLREGMLKQRVRQGGG